MRCVILHQYNPLLVKVMSLIRTEISFYYIHGTYKSFTSNLVYYQSCCDTELYEGLEARAACL
jgi:hypothetical protein